MSLWNMLDELRGATWVDLTHPLTNESPYWAGIPEGSVELCRTVFDYDEEMLSCRIHTYKFPGQFGTHVDFPSHFTPDAVGSEAYEVDDGSWTAMPLCVIDLTGKVAAEGPDTAVTVADIEAWETEHGRIPEGSFVALRTDWYTRWPDNDALNNFDAEGGEHCPGWSMEALKFLYEKRGIQMNGHETFDTDASFLAAEADDLACERYVLDNGHLQVEVMANLDKVPATGAIVFVTWPHIAGATGLPARVIAVFK